MKTGMKIYMKERGRKRRERLISILGNKCKICGSNQNLEFDHINRKDKSFTLSGRELDTKWEIILKELKKMSIAMP